MPMSLGGWSALGITSAVAIVAGIVLLVVYALRRGLTDRELDGTDAADGSLEPATPRSARAGGRTLGLAGATVLAVGLVLGVLSAATGWGGSGAAAGPGAGPVDCAQSWNGCPQVTPAP